MGDAALLLPALPSRQELRDTTAAWKPLWREKHKDWRGYVRLFVRHGNTDTLGVDPYLAHLPFGKCRRRGSGTEGWI